MTSVLRKSLIGLLIACVIGIGGLSVLLHNSKSWTGGKVAYSTTTTNHDPKWSPIIVIDWSGFKSGGPQTYLEGNCMVTRDRSLLHRSQAVVITHRKQKNLNGYPKFRLPSQRWVWLLDESPYHTFMGHKFRLKDIKSTFNWTMTYRTSSDVYIPYSWTTRRKTPATIPKSIGNRTELVSALMSNCVFIKNDRYRYMLALNASIPVHFYGKCFKKLCSGHTGGRYIHNCEEIRKYLFYLAFENSNCKEYVTEKPFNHGFEMGAVPVVRGARREDYEAITPPNSFIYAGDFASPAELGKYLTYLSKNRTAYMKYHEWRKNFTTSYRVHYITYTPVWENLCRALQNDAGEPKTVDLEQFWTKKDCWK